jgi:hypothetical protein
MRQLHNPHRSPSRLYSKKNTIDWQCSDISTFIHVLRSDPTNTGPVIHNSLHCSNVFIIHNIAKRINLTKSILRSEDISMEVMHLNCPNVWKFGTDFIECICCTANTTKNYYISGTT